MKATVLRVTAILAVVMALTAVSAQAQAVVKKQTFVVPFQFNVGKQVLPAGTYTFTGENQTIRIQNKNGRASVIALPQRTLSAPGESQIKLTFRVYGDQYYLAQVWLPDGIGREMKRRPRTNADLAQNFSTVDVTSLGR